MKIRPPRIRVYSYKPGSVSAKTLALTIGGKVLRHVKSVFRPRAGDLIVNWGASDFPQWGAATTLNASVAAASCKLESFTRMKNAGVVVPDFWTDSAGIPDDAFPIVCRTKLRGHSGDGIVIADTRDELVAAPLYVRYVKKAQEYRVHVFNGEAFFVQRKARRHAEENPNWKVRNLAGGFVFVEAGEDDIPQPVMDQSIIAAAAIGVDFGGVDIIWNEHEGKAYVLEINTACGLEDRTAAHYGQQIRNYFENIQ